ncbi:MAG TPA: hypothetical protein ENI74_06220 [Gammaproteobacteria bacterium]|nr:hypothetical protein [Gammaproteobacteria bacterium]
MNTEDEFRIRQTLLKDLFGIAANTTEELDSITDTFDDSQYLLLNSTLLPLQGIGEDNFFLNEYFPADVTLLNFSTVDDYARDDHCFQERARKQEDPDYKIRPYRGDIHRCWARLTIDGTFYYADISSLAGYLTDTLDELGFERIDELIPCQFINGPEHGKREDTGYVYDKRPDANGLEGQLQALRDNYYVYMRERYEVLLDRFNTSPTTCVYMRNRSRNNEPHMDFVFSDATALDAVRFRHFISDCRRIAGDPAEVDHLIEQEKHRALDFLANTYKDIMDNFDPTVVKLRRKCKIILANEKP